jgi:hypothetical protein
MSDSEFDVEEFQSHLDSSDEYNIEDSLDSDEGWKSDDAFDENFVPLMREPKRY